MKYGFTASILAVALAILIYALMPRYYLIFASPESSSTPVVQLGPFKRKLAVKVRGIGSRKSLLEPAIRPTRKQERKCLSLWSVCRGKVSVCSLFAANTAGARRET